MGGFLAGMLCSYLAFSKEGKELTSTIMDNLKRRVANTNEQGEGEDSDRHKKLDDTRGIPTRSE